MKQAFFSILIFYSRLLLLLLHQPSNIVLINVFGSLVVSGNYALLHTYELYLLVSVKGYLKDVRMCFLNPISATFRNLIYIWCYFLLSYHIRNTMLVFLFFNFINETRAKIIRICQAFLLVIF